MPYINSQDNVSESGQIVDSTLHAGRNIRMNSYRRPGAVDECDIHRIQVHSCIGYDEFYAAKIIVAPLETERIAGQRPPGTDVSNPYPRSLRGGMRLQMLREADRGIERKQEDRRQTGQTADIVHFHSSSFIISKDPLQTSEESVHVPEPDEHELFTVAPLRYNGNTLGSRGDGLNPHQNVQERFGRNYFDYLR